jgi:hypothetical protein
MTNLNSNEFMAQAEIKQMDMRDQNKLQSEKNMFYMALTLCSISILSRQHRVRTLEENSHLKNLSEDSLFGSL